MVLGAIVNTCQEYYRQFPSDTVPKMCKSALYSFTITFVLVRNPQIGDPFNVARPLLAASVASLASLIYALTNPIFNMIFGDKLLRLHREIIKQIVNVTLSSLLIHYSISSKVNLLALPLIGSVSMNLFKSLFELVPSMVESLFNDETLAD